MALENQLPTGTTSNQWDVIFGGATAHDVLNDPVGSPDDDSTYIENTDATNANIDCTHTPFVLSGATSVDDVCQVMRCKETSSSSGQARHLIYVGARYNGTTQSPGASYTTYTDMWTTNPATGLAWTIAEADGTDATNPYDSKTGVRALTGVGESVRLTQMYACCNFQTAAGGLSIPVAMHHLTKNIGSGC